MRSAQFHVLTNCALRTAHWRTGLPRTRQPRSAPDESPETAGLSDEALMMAVREGTTDYFGVLLRRYETRVITFAYRMVGNYETARDILQQAFLKILEQAGHYEPRAQFSTFLYQVTRNLCINELKRSARRRSISLDQEMYSDAGQVTFLRDALPNGTGTPEDNLLLQESRNAVRRVIAKLPPIYREVVVLRIFEELPYREISKITGAGENTVKSRMRYALERLQAAMRRAMGATCSAFSMGTTITPSPSATITSPGRTSTPPQFTGWLMESSSSRPGLKVREMYRE